MLISVRLSLCLAAVASLAACHGAAGGLTPSVPGDGMQSNAGVRAAAAVSLRPIGPWTMDDGYPSSGKVNALAIDPKNPKILYVASGRGTGLETYSSAGLYRTIDGGKTWQPAMSGLVDGAGMISSVVNSLWLDPNNPSTLLAATEYDGIYRSTDAGGHWTREYATTLATQFVAMGSTLYAATKTGILSSNDDGATWSVVFAGSPTRYPTAFGAAKTALYAGMSDGSIYALRGSAWTHAGTLPYDSSTGTDGSTPQVHQIAVDPLVPTTLYANSNDGSWDQDLHASTDGGKTWNYVLRGKYGRYGLGTQAIAFSAVHPHRLYIGSDGWMYWVDGNGAPNPVAHSGANLTVIDNRDLWISANGGDDACWIASDQGLDYEPTCSTYLHTPNDNVVTKTLAIGLARRFVVSPDRRMVLASFQDFDSFQTNDAGKSWHAKYALYEDGFNELRPNNPSLCFAYDEASGLQFSSDGCGHFSRPSTMAGKLYPSRLMTTPIAFDPKNPATMYLCAGPIVGFSRAATGIYRTQNDGASFVKLAWPFSQPGMIAIDPQNGNHLVIGDLRAGRSSISVTFDGGKTWKASAGVPASAFWYSATIAWNGKSVLASSVDANDNVYVLRSSDGGLTFAKAATVVNAPLLRGRIDPDRGADAFDRSPSHPAAFVYSPAREIRYNPNATAGTPYAVLTTLRGAYLSSDNGTTWQRLDAALVAHSFWGIRWIGGYLYLASDGQGVVASSGKVQ